MGIAIPNFWLAMVLIAIFADQPRLVPAIGWTKFQDIPMSGSNTSCYRAVVLGVWAAASLARNCGPSLIDTLDTNYVRTAWAKGTGPARAS